MSDNMFVKKDPGWEKFISTGSIFDYLNYKNHTAIQNDCFDRVVEYGKGGNREDRDKRSSS